MVKAILALLLLSPTTAMTPKTKWHLEPAGFSPARCIQTWRQQPCLRDDIVTGYIVRYTPK